MKRGIFKFFITSISALVITCQLNGCSSAYQKPSYDLSPPTQSSFHQHNDTLTYNAKPSGTHAWFWQSESFDPGAYHDIVVMPTLFYPGKGKFAKQVPQHKREHVSKKVDYIIKNSAQRQGIQLASTPNNNSLVIRAAITNLEVKTKRLQPYEMTGVTGLSLAGIQWLLGYRDKEVSCLFEYEIQDGTSRKALYREIREVSLKPLKNYTDKFDVYHVNKVFEDLAMDFNQDLRVIALELNRDTDSTRPKKSVASTTARLDAPVQTN